MRSEGVGYASDSLIGEDRIGAAESTCTGHWPGVVKRDACLTETTPNIGCEWSTVLKAVIAIKHHIVAMQISANRDRSAGGNSINVILTKSEFEFSRDALIPPIPGIACGSAGEPADIVIGLRV